MGKKLTVTEIKHKIKSAYPDYKIHWDTTGFKNSRSRCKFTVDGKDFFAIVEHMTRGFVKFRGLNKNHQILSEEAVLSKIIKKTKEKHPTITIKLSIFNKSYVDSKTRCKFILNDEKIIESTPYNLMKHGISLKNLGLKKQSKNKSDPKELLKNIQQGWTDKHGNSYPPRPFISFNLEKFKTTAANLRFNDSQCGEWEAYPYRILRGANHPKRSKEKLAKEMCFTAEEIQERILKGTTTKKGRVILGRDYLKIVPESYTLAKAPCKFIDSVHGEFTCLPARVIAGQDHPKRYRAKSKAEREIEFWLESLNIKCERNKKFNLKNKIKEVDVYLNDYKVGIDHHGLYWHSELKRTHDDHFNRRVFFNKKKVFLFQILENEWRDKKQVVQSLILKKIKHDSIKKINSKKLTVQKVDKNTAREFIGKNGLYVPKQKESYLGLFHKDELVSVLSYSGKAINSITERIDCAVPSAISKYTNFLSLKSITLDLRYEDMNPFLRKGFVLDKTIKGFMWTDYYHTYPAKSEVKNPQRWTRIFDAGRSTLSRL